MQQFNEEKDKLFSIIAHDLKSPLSGLMASTQMLAEDVEAFSEEEISRLAKELHKSTRNMMALLEDLMQWARMSQGTLEFVLEPSSLHELANISLASAQGVAGQKDISISVDISHDMTVMVDKPMINTVIRNLLFNAVKFTPRGGKILVAAQHEGEYIRVAVDLAVEHLDMRRYFRSEYEELVSGFLAEKHRAFPKDLIIVSDDAALDFLLRFRNDIFSHIPVVFCGINNFAPERIAGQRNITGVNEAVSMVETLELGLRLFARTEKSPSHKHS